MNFYKVVGHGHWLGLYIIVMANNEKEAIEQGLIHLKENDEYLYNKNVDSNFMEATLLDFTKSNAFIIWDGEY